MSTFVKRRIECGMCGKKSNFFILASTNEFGNMDLDTRPPEMMRSDMLYAICRCPQCDYVAYDISKSKKNINKTFLNSKKYKTCDGRNYEKHAKSFYQLYLIDIKSNEFLSAVYDLLTVAWIFDDVENVIEAKRVRLELLILIDKLIEKIVNGEIKIKTSIENIFLIKIDLLRRSDQFAKVIEECKSINVKDTFIKKLIKLEVKLCKAKDNRSYRIDGEVNIINKNKANEKERMYKLTQEMIMKSFKKKVDKANIEDIKIRKKYKNLIFDIMRVMHKCKKNEMTIEELTKKDTKVLINELISENKLKQEKIDGNIYISIV